MQSINTLREDVNESVQKKLTTSGSEVLWRLKDTQRSLAGAIESLEANPMDAMRNPGFKETIRMMKELVNDSEGQAWWSSGLVTVQRLVD